MTLRELHKLGIKLFGGSTMDHFIGWKFGVPVKVLSSNCEYSTDFLLVRETDTYFTVISTGVEIGYSLEFSKIKGFTYKLIPYKYGGKPYAPRYPLCSNKKGAAFCNAGNNFNDMGTALGGLAPCPAATLNIDGKTIELSAETTAELKKKLGV